MTLGMTPRQSKKRTSAEGKSRPEASLPDTFWIEKTRREKEEANEIVSTKRKEIISLEGRSQWMHRSHYGRTGTSKSRSCCQECMDIRRKPWPCVCWAWSCRRVQCCNGWPKR